jgi:hypothetical protein
MVGTFSRYLRLFQGGQREEEEEEEERLRELGKKAAWLRRKTQCKPLHAN